MHRVPGWISWRPTPATLIAAGLVVGGLVLSEVNWWFLVLTGIGTFGPGILRELGWLHDKDEFQMRAAHRAGYHAFLVTGLIAFILVAFFRSGEREVKDLHELATMFLVLLWCTWLFSSLFAYWGAQKAAARFLVVFGICWLFFMILSDNGSVMGLLMQSLVATPFFILAWLAGRRPRVAGVCLLLISAFFVYFFGWYEIGSMGLVNQAVVMMTFLGPLLGGGLALIGVRRP